MARRMLQRHDGELSGAGSSAVATVTCELTFASGGCNRVSGCLAYSEDGELLYGAGAHVLAIRERDELHGPDWVQVLASADGSSAHVTNVHVVQLERANVVLCVSARADKSVFVSQRRRIEHANHAREQPDGKLEGYLWAPCLSYSFCQDDGIDSNKNQAAGTREAMMCIATVCAEEVARTEGQTRYIVLVLAAFGDGKFRLLALDMESDEQSGLCSSTVTDYRVHIEEMDRAWLPESVAMAQLPGHELNDESSLVVALGGSDKNVYVALLAWPRAGNAEASAPHLVMHGHVVASLSGHSDWIRSVAFDENLFVKRSARSESTESALLLASGSNDGSIRIWSIAETKERNPRAQSDAEDAEDEEDSYLSTLLGTAKSRFRCLSHSRRLYEVACLKRLGEHSDKVTCVKWSSSRSRDCVVERMPQRHLLASCSIDSSVAVWCATTHASVFAGESPASDEQVEALDWELAARFGLLGGIGTYALGFYGCEFAAVQRSDTLVLEVIAHSFTGSVHTWEIMQDHDRTSLSANARAALPPCAAGGHLGAVNDLIWDPLGRDFFVSVGEDKTSRMYGMNRSQFAEMFRPQVHGHPVYAGALVPCNDGLVAPGNVVLVTGAEEKILRAFCAPSSFAAFAEGNEPPVNMAELSVATLPELGLSNKANTIVSGKASATAAQAVAAAAAAAATTGISKLEPGIMPEEEHEDDVAGLDGAHEDVAFMATGATEHHTQTLAGHHGWRPLPEDLLQNRLWAEITKMYGHGNELAAITSSQSGSVVASSCKSTDAKHASIILWTPSPLSSQVQAQQWVDAQRLAGHASTINQLTFSPSPADQYLLSVGRDRTLCVFRRDRGPLLYTLACQVKEAHRRSIECAAWLSTDSPSDAQVMYFVTGSRDKKLKLWRLWCPNHANGDEKLEQLHELGFASGVSSVSAALVHKSGQGHLVAVGTEEGGLALVYVSLGGSLDGPVQVHDPLHLPSPFSSCSRIHRVQFQPPSAAPGANEDVGVLRLGVAGSDSLVRVLRISLPGEFRL